MVRTRFALVLYFRMVAHKAACHTMSKAFLEINADMVQVLLMLEILFTQNSKDEDMFCSATPGSELSLSFSNYLLGLGFKTV